MNLLNEGLTYLYFYFFKFILHEQKVSNTVFFLGRGGDGGCRRVFITIVKCAKTYIFFSPRVLTYSFFFFFFNWLLHCVHLLSDTRTGNETPNHGLCIFSRYTIFFNIIMSNTRTSSVHVGAYILFILLYYTGFYYGLSGFQVHWLPNMLFAKSN